MDRTRRNELVTRLQAVTPVLGPGPGPTASLEEFFEGNDDPGSIGCNLMPMLEPKIFYDVFRQIRSRPDVQDVRVQICDYVDDDSWPFSDSVFFLTSMPQAELAKLLSELQPDDVGTFSSEHIPEDLPKPNPGMTIYGAWWD
jgi:hypothetical protein